MIYDLRSTMKSNDVIAEKPFQNSGVTRRLWTLGPGARRQYILLVIIIIIIICLKLRPYGSVEIWLI